MNTNTKIFLAGHRGMVGSAIHRHLVSKGFSNIITRERGELDLLNQHDTESFLKEAKPDIVILAAARVGGIYANNTYRAEFIYENIQLQNCVIHGCYKAGVHRLLFLGSSCIYPRNAPQPIKEVYLLTGELEPTNEPYAVAKIAGIKMCQAYNDQYGTDFISVMPTNLYGPNDNFDLDTSHVLPALVRKFHLAKLIDSGEREQLIADVGLFTRTVIAGYEMLTYLGNHGINKGYVELWGTGSPKREFMHVDDMAAASMHTLAMHSGNEIVNIGVGADLSIKDLALLIREVVGYEGEIRWNTDYPDGTPRKLLDTSRLKSLGWDDARDLRQGIEEVYHWYRQQLVGAM